MPELEILPYNSFLKRELPATLIYLHMTGYSTKQRLRIVGELQQMFPDVTVLTNNWFDSSQFRWETLVRCSLAGIRFSVLVWAALSLCFSLWLENNKRINRVLKLCGISMAENCVQIFLLLFILVFLGEGLALLLQFA